MLIEYLQSGVYVTSGMYNQIIVVVIVTTGILLNLMEMAQSIIIMDVAFAAIRHLPGSQ